MSENGVSDAPVAIVIGGASGIGAATAQMLAELGWHTILADLNRVGGEATAARIGNAEFIVTDVSNEAEVEAVVARAMARFGRLDCLVHSAGLVGATGTILEMTGESWRKTNAVLFDSVFYAIKHTARAMAPANRGAIVVVSSIAGVVGGVGAHAYTAAKHGVIGLVKSAASELAAMGITVNSVAPGSTVTPLVSSLRGSVEAAIQGSIDTSPLRRPIMPEDIARTILFFVGEGGRNITGQTLVVDGGRMVAAGSGGPGAVNFHDKPAVFIPAVSQQAG
ncbi:MAG: short chain dehydrogenase family protein [Sphingomonas bacterium]|nr:short chain dehydrogenase family protein [Sphingomonas bacterium]